MNKDQLERLRRRNAESKRQHKYDMMMRKRYDDKMLARYGQIYGPRSTLKDYERWYWSIEGRAYARKIVDDDWKRVGKPNPNPRRWDTGVTWHGKRVK